MDNEFVFDNKLLDEEDIEKIIKELKQQGYDKEDIEFYLTDTDFYPPSDNRFWTSNVKDIRGGDTFADYCTYIFKLYEEEGCYDN